MPLNEAEIQYVNLYDQCREMICKHSVSVMNDERDEAYQLFKAKGLPTRKQERYKYTDMEALFAPDYGLNLQRLTIPVNPQDVFKCDVPNLSTALYFMVNDQLLPASHTHLPEGVIVDSISHLASTGSEVLAKYFGKLAKASEAEGDQLLNMMLAQDGMVVFVPRGVRMEKTLQVVNILRSDVDLMVNRRLLVVVEEGAEAKLLFCDHASDDVRFLATQTTEVFVGANAHLEMYNLEETNVKTTLVTNTFVAQERDSSMHHNVVTLHNGTTRNRLDLVMRGEGAECYCNGCVIADKQQHVDNNTLITHLVPHCQSNELYKYVADDDSTGAFAGRVLVVKDAQKTTSTMVNQNLCGTDRARIYTQPMLEIYADDVKCSHGSTVGQLNDQAMFYMRQRGISYEEARLLLQTAFIYEVIDQITLEPLRDRLHHLVDKRFRGELNKCSGCQSCAK